MLVEYLGIIVVVVLLIIEDEDDDVDDDIPHQMYVADVDEKLAFEVLSVVYV